MSNTNKIKQLPIYQSHKRVQAFKIANIENHPDGEENNYTLIPTDSELPKLHVSDDYYNKHYPKIGGYYVVYEDGYKSFSPPEAFEKGNTECSLENTVSFTCSNEMLPAVKSLLGEISSL